MSRFRVQPGDVPKSAAAQRMGMTVDAFTAVEPNLVARGFPKPDRDTGNYDLDAINAWRRLRHPHLFNTATTMGARDASTVVRDRLASMRGAGR
jgi:hypothetical protein